MRKCYYCKKVKLLSEFCNNKREKYGKAYECKSCKAIKDKEYRLKNKQAISVFGKLKYAKEKVNQAILIKDIEKLLKATELMCKAIELNS